MISFEQFKRVFKKNNEAGADFQDPVDLAAQNKQISCEFLEERQLRLTLEARLAQKETDLELAILGPKSWKTPIPNLVSR